MAERLTGGIACWWRGRCIPNTARCWTPTRTISACRSKKSDTRSSGQVDVPRSEDAIDYETAAVVVQSPNFFGVLEELPALAETAHAAGALLVRAITEGVSLGIVRPPAEADIVAMEAQSFGLPPSYGGPLRRRDRHARKIRAADARPPGGADRG